MRHVLKVDVGQQLRVGIIGGDRGTAIVSGLHCRSQQLMLSQHVCLCWIAGPPECPALSPSPSACPLTHAHKRRAKYQRTHVQAQTSTHVHMHARDGTHVHGNAPISCRSVSATFPSPRFAQPSPLPLTLPSPITPLTSLSSALLPLVHPSPPPSVPSGGVHLAGAAPATGIATPTAVRPPGRPKPRHARELPLLAIPRGSTSASVPSSSVPS